ncbi:MAG: AAA family ATPase [Ideonella sp.]|nr:AAA family ATPase [Ideonella sp.]MCC7457859.1 AAA family ATPase [Nitrospira sp.]
MHPLERHDAALLALLVVERRVSRARAAELLWPGRPSQQARNSLRQRLFKLRRAGGHALVDGDEWLSLADGVRSDWPADAVDGAGGAHAPLLDGQRYHDLEQFDEWLVGARERWQAARRGRWLQAADALEREGRFDAALAPAALLVEHEPLDETAHRRLIRLHYLCGDRAAALEAYRRCRAVLADELGVEPDSETRGLARLVERSGAPAAAREPGAPLSLRRTPRLVGRDAVWQQLSRAWAECGVVHLGGEAGIGKSRLAREFAAAHPGALVCGARPGDAAQPYALLARLMHAVRQRIGETALDAGHAAELARVAPDYGTAAAGAADAERLLRAIRAELARCGARGVQGLVIDDLQFADAASVEALVDWLCSEASAGMPHLLIARSGEWPAVLRRSHAPQPARRGIEIELPPLDEPGLRELLRSLALEGFDAAGPWVARLMRHTGGHPLFVLETLIACHHAGGSAAFADDAPLPAPLGVERLIDRRLEQLPAPALRLAHVMALAGADCGAEVFAAVLQCDVIDLIGAWRELERREIAGGAGLAHDLIEAAVLRSIPAEIRRVLHARIGRERQARRHAPARVARHLLHGEAWAEAAAQLIEAAGVAAGQSRRDEEVELLGAAIDAFERCADHRGAFAARLRRAEAMMTTGSLARAHHEIALLERAARADAERLQQRLLAAKAALAAGDALAGVAAAGAAEALAVQLGDEPAVFKAGQLLASALAAHGRAAEALAKLESLGPLAQSCSDPRDVCEYHGSIGYVLCVVGRRRQAVAHLGDAAERAQALGDATEAMTLWSNLAGTLMQLGEVEQGAALAERAHALSLHAGPRQGVAVGSNETMLGLGWHALGRFGDAERVLLDALQRFRSGGAAIWIVATEGMLANLYVTLHQTARARGILSPVAAEIPAARRARRLVVEARIERAAGRSGSARFNAAMALIDASPQRSMDRIGTTLAWAQAAPPDEALPRLREVLEASEAQGLDGMVLSARVREVDALRRRGDLAAAAAQAREVMAQAEHRRPHDIYAGEFWWLLAEACAAGGDRDGADTALDAAARWIRAALPHVPEAYRDGFVHRHPINRQVLAAAARRWPGALR